MKKYKLLTVYPSLDPTWEVGMEIFTDNSKLSYTPIMKKYANVGLSINEVENNPKYWERIIEKEYEILSVISNYGFEKNVLITYNSDGVCIERTDVLKPEKTSSLNEILIYDNVAINCVKRISDSQLFYIGEQTNFGKIKRFHIDGYYMVVDYDLCSKELSTIEHINEKFEVINWEVNGGLPYSMNKNIVPDLWIIGYQCASKKINSVKRDIDGQIFTVGDIVKEDYGGNKTIKSFKITKKQGAGRHFFGEDLIYVTYDSDCGGNWLNSINKVEKKPLFKTEDGVDIFEGDAYWFVVTECTIANSYWKATRHTCDWAEPKRPPLGRVQFSTKEKSQEYIDLNKPQYSLNGIRRFLTLNDIHIGVDYLKNKLNECKDNTKSN